MAEKIVAYCPCGKRYEVPDDVLGKKMRCKECGDPFRIKEEEPPKTEVPVERYSETFTPAETVVAYRLPATKACPYCEEQILGVAKKCKHCGEFLDGFVRPQTVPTQVYTPGLAALLSIVFPGAGQIYKGSLGDGVAWFAVVVAGYILFILPGVCLHVVCVIEAAKPIGASRRRQAPAPVVVAVVLAATIAFVAMAYKVMSMR